MLEHQCQPRLSSNQVEDEIETTQELPFQKIVGRLQWTAQTTRPDIAYAVTQISKFNSAWTLKHWIRAKHILRYLKAVVLQA